MKIHLSVKELYRKRPTEPRDPTFLGLASNDDTAQRRLIRQAPMPRPVFLASFYAAATLAMSSMCFAVTWSNWAPIPDTGTKWHSLSGPFVTDSVCSVAAPTGDASPSATLYVVARKAVDQTIWLNSTDKTQQTWDGWREIPGNAHTAYPPSVSYYGTQFGKQLDVIAVGITGGADHAVYINSYSFILQTWSGWKLVPGLLTNSGVSIVDRHLCAKEWLYADQPSSIYHNEYNPSSGWTGWKAIPGGLITTAQVCAYSNGPGVTVLATRSGFGQIHRVYSEGSYWTGWTPVGLYFTNTKVAAAMDPYQTFYNGSTDHRLYGVSAGLEQIPGNMLTDSGLESCRMLLYSSAIPKPGGTSYSEFYKNLLFAKSIGDHKLYFTSYNTTYSWYNPD
jgi:hypothetical protein